MKKKIGIYLGLLFVSCSLSANSGISAKQTNANDESDYTEGIFIVNEDWYSHQNSTVNYLMPDEDDPWTYRVFQRENPGKELGCTSQFGTIYGDKFYIVSKQEKDPGAAITGSRLVVCDAKTMKCLKEFPIIAADETGKSIADGRSFLGVDEKTGYIGTSNGIWLYDIENMEIGDLIPGTENPNKEGYGKLYYAQVGAMLRAGDRVFAVHQENGIMVIDAHTHKVDTVIEGAYGSVIQSLDESLWVSVAANTSGMGDALPYLVRLNPYTLETQRLDIPDEIEMPGNSWYAWTADGFCSSAVENKIYWSGQKDNSWFKGKRIYCYDIDNNTFSEIFDVEAYGWTLYGTAFRLHPVTDEIYAFIYHEFTDNTHRLLRLSTENVEKRVIREYEMILNHWFPALPVFPDNHAPEIIDIPSITVENNKSYTLPLRQYITDPDNSDAAIVRSVESVSDESLFTASIVNGNLQIVPESGREGSGTITLKINSNGKTAEKTIPVIALASSSIGTETVGNYSVYAGATNLYINGFEGYHLSIFDLYGRAFDSFYADTDNYVKEHKLSDGVYVIYGKKGDKIISQKVIIKK